MCSSDLPLAADHYAGREPEFSDMSRRPGIGSAWLKKFTSDVFPRDYVVARGFESKPPRFYDKLLDRNFPDLVDDVKFSRYTKAMLRQDDETDERLAVREQVALAKLGNLPRSLE